MKNYLFKKQGIVVKAVSERQAREIYNQYLHDSSDLGVAEFLKSKGIKFSKIDGTNDNVIIEFDNEKDWTLGSKELQTKFGRKGYESRKEGNSYKVILGDSITENEVINELRKVGLTLTSQAKKDIKWNILDYINNANLTAKEWVKMIISGNTEDVSDIFEKTGNYNKYFKDSFMNDNFFEDLRSADKIADYGWTLEERHEVAKDFFNESLEKGLTFEQAVKEFDTFLNDVKKEFNKKIDVAKKHFVNMKRDYIDKYDKFIEDSETILYDLSEYRDIALPQLIRTAKRYNCTYEGNGMIRGKESDVKKVVKSFYRPFKSSNIF